MKPTPAKAMPTSATYRGESPTGIGPRLEPASAMDSAFCHSKKVAVKTRPTAAAFTPSKAICCTEFVKRTRVCSVM
eukprot:5105-Heterococcus_DN1.PRE.8